MIEPEYQVTDADRASLAQMCLSDGFKVFQKLCESEINKFTIKLLNTDAADDKTIVATHKVAKAAAQFYQGIVQRVNEEVHLLYNTPKIGEIIPDVTEEILSI